MAATFSYFSELIFRQRQSSVFATTIGTIATLTACRALSIAFETTTLRGHRIVLKDFALEDPDLDAADAERGFRFSCAVVDVRTQRVQRNASFTVPFGTSDFGATETATAGDLDAFGAKTHCGLNRTLHRTAESHAALELLGDRLSDESRVDFRLAHFNDVEVRFGVGHLRKLLAKLLDVRALLADDETRTSRMDRNAALLVRTLDDNLGDTGLLEFLDQVSPDLQVFMQQLAVFSGVSVPAAIPGTVDAEAEADRIDFLTHYAASPFSSTSRTTIVR
ncbi:hypothetical protein AGR1A_Cc40379 [Agrobacterium fabacearum CFBP 5771]|nr:hypothetical protein AGR1A_Cc40379 [Agrobacterium fabacearum CFBP 5771]